MDERTGTQLYARLSGSGPPLSELALGRMLPALDPDAVAALQVDRATRDRLVIFDPLSAPFVRPLVLADDLRPWHTAASGAWIVAVPAVVAPTLAERHPALARHLAQLPSLGSASSPWWALPPAALAAAAAPRILVGARGNHCAWDETAALVGGPATVIAAAEPYWLALLGSRVGARLLREGGVSAFPVPEAPGPARAGLEGLALSAVALAGQIHELERAVLRRLVADFGPPGIRPGPRLSRWWELSFEELHAAVLAELGNDIPQRFRPTWADIHADQQATHAEAAARLAALQTAIDTQVEAVYGLEPGGTG